MIRGLAAALLFVAPLLLAAPMPAPADGWIDEPGDYRMGDFRSPVPETLLDAAVLDDAAARAAWEAGALFIDVLPRPPKPANLPEGTIWIDRKRDSIPGARWLPNVGFGRLDPARDAYFRDALERLTEGDRERRVVFFCLIDCWMSWNAARRAILDYGYENVAWYPDGSDGWSMAGNPLAPVEPEPGATGAAPE